MKKTFHITPMILILFSAAGLTYAGDMNMPGMPMPEASDGKMNMQVHHATGVVTKVDPDAGRITISHGPIQTIPWPAMTMGFPVKDRKMLDAVTVGEKVDFDLAPTGQDRFMVVRIRPAQH